MRMLPVMTMMLLLAACASSNTGREVAAVVQDEGARQAAVMAAQDGADSKDALKAGADAAARDKDVSEPRL